MSNLPSLSQSVTQMLPPMPRLGGSFCLRRWRGWTGDAINCVAFPNLGSMPRSKIFVQQNTAISQTQ